MVFHGEVSNERKAELLAGARALLFPVREPEPFGLAMVEALASGTPVIAADTGGLRYVVRDGVTGFLVPGHDPGDYADRLLTVLSDRVGARRMGDAAAANSLRFSWDATATDVLGVYRELLGQIGRVAVGARAAPAVDVADADERPAASNR